MTWIYRPENEDLSYAIEQAVTTKQVFSAEQVKRQLELEEQIEDLLKGATIVEFAIRFHDGMWEQAIPREWVGSELDLTVVLKLHDDRYMLVEASNDYTGWGCQDYAAIYLGSMDDVYRWAVVPELADKLNAAASSIVLGNYIP